jgi:hypothetical protein
VHFFFLRDDLREESAQNITDVVSLLFIQLQVLCHPIQMTVQHPVHMTSTLTSGRWVMRGGRALTGRTALMKIADNQSHIETDGERQQEKPASSHFDQPPSCVIFPRYTSESLPGDSPMISDPMVGHM